MSYFPIIIEFTETIGTRKKGDKMVARAPSDIPSGQGFIVKKTRVKL